MGRRGAPYIALNSTNSRAKPLSYLSPMCPFWDIIRVQLIHPDCDVPTSPVLGATSTLNAQLPERPHSSVPLSNEKLGKVALSRS